jgi:hypothetical protein
MDKGIGELNWLHLKGMSIHREERIKTNMRSWDGRTPGRLDEQINPSYSGRTSRNCDEVFRIHKAKESIVRHMSNHSELWKKLPWKKFQRNLFRLQCRVYKAVAIGDMRKARSLQKLILKSQGLTTPRLWIT